jgi:hypothetical protein
MVWKLGWSGNNQIRGVRRRARKRYVPRERSREENQNSPVHNRETKEAESSRGSCSRMGPNQNLKRSFYQRRWCCFQSTMEGWRCSEDCTHPVAIEIESLDRRQGAPSQYRGYVQPGLFWQKARRCVVMMMSMGSESNRHLEARRIGLVAPFHY